MMQAPPPPQYYTPSQAQLYPSAVPSYHYGAPQVQAVPSYQQSLVVPQYSRQQLGLVQRQRASYWSMLCCFKGQNSAHLRHACMIFGTLIVLHGVMSITFALFFALGHINKSDSGAGEFYTLFVAPLSALFLSGVNEVFPTVVSFMYPLLVDICGGACLILGGMFLQEILCYLSIASFAVALIGNLMNTMYIFFATFVIVAARLHDASSRLYYMHASIFRFGACVYLIYCIAGALALRDQIQDGEYVQWAARPQHPAPAAAAMQAPMTQSMMLQTGASDEVNAM